MPNFFRAPLPPFIFCLRTEAEGGEGTYTGPRGREIRLPPHFPLAFVVLRLLPSGNPFFSGALTLLPGGDLISASPSKYWNRFSDMRRLQSGFLPLAPHVSKNAFATNGISAILPQLHSQRTQHSQYPLRNRARRSHFRRKNGFSRPTDL